MINTFDLSGKVVLITGGYGYLGKAITESLLYHGANVYVLGLDKEKFLKAFSELGFSKGNLHYLYCDISQTLAIKKAFKTIYEKETKIDVLINNAFYLEGQSPENMTDEEWEIGIEGVLGSVFKSIREIIPFFKTQRYGNIVNVSSMYGLVAPHFEVYEQSPSFLNPPHYGAAKAAIIQLTKYYAAYLGRTGVRVNVVTPGPFPSNEVQKNHQFISELEGQTCLGRIGQPSDLAGAFVFLASDASNFMTGQNIIIDGGWTIK